MHTAGQLLLLPETHSAIFYPSHQLRLYHRKKDKTSESRYGIMSTSLFHIGQCRNISDIFAY